MAEDPRCNVAGCDEPWLYDHLCQKHYEDGADGDTGPARPAEGSPRVWFNGDDVPAGVWVLDHHGEVRQLDEYEDCGNGNLGPLVEVVLPDYDAIVAAAEVRRVLCGEPFMSDWRPGRELVCTKTRGHTGRHDDV